MNAPLAGLAGHLPAGHLPAGQLLAGAVHEFRGVEDGAAQVEFVVLLLARLTGGSPILWVSAAPSAYAPGLFWLGLDPGRCIFARAKDETEALGVLEVALRGGMTGVAEARALPRLAARRLALAARQGGGTGFLVRQAPAFTRMDSTAPATRWLISAVPGAPGRPRLQAELLYARGGRPGVFCFEIAKEDGDAATPPALALLAEWRAAGSGALRHTG